MFHNTKQQQFQSNQYKEFCFAKDFHNNLSQTGKKSPHRLDYKTPPHKLNNCVLFKKNKKTPEQIKRINFKISFGNFNDKIQPMQFENQIRSIEYKNRSKEKYTPTQNFVFKSASFDSKKLDKSNIKQLLKQLLLKIERAFHQVEEVDLIDKLQGMIDILAFSGSKYLKKHSFKQKRSGSKSFKLSSTSPKKQLRKNDVQIEMQKVEKNKKQSDKIYSKQKQIQKFLKYLQSTTKK